jgi:hypothetical protein
MPFNLSSVLPVASTSSRSCFVADFRFLSIRSSSTISSAASRRRVLPTTSCGRTVASSGFGLRRGQERLRPTGNQLEQQAVQPVHRQRPRGAEFVPPIGQQAQRHCRAIDPHDAQVGGA